MILYFSGTGNSKYCAQMLSDLLSDKIQDISDFLAHQNTIHLNSDRPWVFVCPIYAWRIPHVVADFIRSNQFSGNQLAYFVVTCGAEIGNAAKEIQNLCRQTGLYYQGCLSIVMPDNCIALFPAPTQQEITQTISTAQSYIKESVSMIQQQQAFPNPKVSMLDSFKSSAINYGMYHFFINPKKFYATDSCISCGLCEQVCPLSNIQLKNGKPIWGKQCTLCMACICHCPKTAIEYGKLTAGKTRYLCPEYHKNP